MIVDILCVCGVQISSQLVGREEW